MVARTMRTAACVGVIGLAVGLMACRQPDGPIPVPAGELENRVEDLSRDLQNIAGRQPAADTELLDDLQTLDVQEPSRPLVLALAEALGGALAGEQLVDADARQLANLLFVAATGRELSTRQIGRIGEDVEAVLLKVGASDPAAQRVAAAVTAIASAVTRNSKRWYHIGS